LDSSLVEDFKPPFNADPKDIYLNSFKNQNSIQEESKNVSSSNDSARDIDKLLNIDDKFKYALRNIAEK